jgi:hypothetical protein
MSENTIVHITVRKLVSGKRSVLTPVLAPAIPSETARGFIQSPLQIPRDGHSEQTCIREAFSFNPGLGASYVKWDFPRFSSVPLANSKEQLLN